MHEINGDRIITIYGTSYLASNKDYIIDLGKDLYKQLPINSETDIRENKAFNKFLTCYHQKPVPDFKGCLNCLINPVTQNFFIDPVVNAAGDTVEKSEETQFPNLWMKDLIELIKHESNKELTNQICSFFKKNSGLFLRIEKY